MLDFGKMKVKPKKSKARWKSAEECRLQCQPTDILAVCTGFPVVPVKLNSLKT